MPIRVHLQKAAQSGELPWPCYWGITLAPMAFYVAPSGYIPWPSTKYPYSVIDSVRERMLALPWPKELPPEMFEAEASKLADPLQEA